jgi:hypothetical protein
MIHMWSSEHLNLRGGAIAAVLLGLLWSPTDTASAEIMRARGKSEQARVIARSEIPLGDMVTGRLESLFRVLKGDAPEWNNAQVFSVRFSDPQMRQNQIMRGHMIVIHADGDRTFLEYEMTWKPGGGTTEFRLTGRFVRGTGKFTGITGRWTERGFSSTTEDTSEWEVEYQRAGG